MCICVEGRGHAEEAAYQEMEGLQLTQALCPSRAPRAWSPIPHLAPRIGSPSGWAGALLRSLPPPPGHAVCAKHSEGHTSVSPAPCPGLQGREGRKALAGVLAQLRELLAHLPDNHAVHLALGRGFLFGQDAPQGGLQVGEPVAVLQVRRGADHRVHQGQVLHAQLQEEWLSSGTQGRHCHRPWTGTDHVGPRVHGPARSTEDQGHTPSTHPVPGPELASRAAKQMNGWTVLDTGSPRTGPAHRSPGLERRQGQTASSCPSLLCGQRPPNPNRPPHSEDLTHTHSFRY